jgi:hypothetical protein
MCDVPAACTTQAEELARSSVVNCEICVPVKPPGR